MHYIIFMGKKQLGKLMPLVNPLAFQKSYIRYAPIGHLSMKNHAVGHLFFFFFFFNNFSLLIWDFPYQNKVQNRHIFWVQNRHKIGIPILYKIGPLTETGPN